MKFNITKFDVFKWFLYAVFGILLANNGITIVDQTGKFISFMALFGAMDIVSHLQNEFE